MHVHHHAFLSLFGGSSPDVVGKDMESGRTGVARDAAGRCWARHGQPNTTIIGPPRQPADPLLHACPPWHRGLIHLALKDRMARRIRRHAALCLPERFGLRDKIGQFFTTRFRREDRRLPEKSASPQSRGLCGPRLPSAGAPMAAPAKPCGPCAGRRPSPEIPARRRRRPTAFRSISHVSHCTI